MPSRVVRPDRVRALPTLAAGILLAVGCGGRSSLALKTGASSAGGSGGRDAGLVFGGPDVIADTAEAGKALDRETRPEAGPEARNEAGREVERDAERDSADGAHGDLGSDGPAEGNREVASDLAETGRDAAADGASETIREVAPDLGSERAPDAGADLGSERAPDVGADLGSERAVDAGADLRVPSLELLAGWMGGPGSADGVGQAARFHAPWGLATDGAGNLFVADQGNCTIRQLALASATVTTLAGSPGSCGIVDGAGAQARFSMPAGMISDGQGNLLVADISWQGTIRQVAIATGQVTTVLGLPDGAPAPDGGSRPTVPYLWSMASDGSGNLLVTQRFETKGVIRRVVLATGAVTTYAGSPEETGGDDGIGTAARFVGPLTLVADGQGNLFVADSGNATIRQVVVATGAVTTLAGAPGQTGGDDGIGAKARFANPQGLALDGSGNLLVSDGQAVRQVVIATGQVTTLAGASGQPGSDDGTGGNARFQDVAGLACDGEGQVFVADHLDDAIRRIVVASQEVTVFAGSPLRSDARDGVGIGARFTSPLGLAGDGAGSLFVTDQNAIRKLGMATGAVSTLAGAVASGGAIDGVSSAARFLTPKDVASDGKGNLFVADQGNSVIRQIDIATGAVTTLAGAAGTTGKVDGPGSTARFGSPSALAYDPAGYLLVADQRLASNYPSNVYACAIRKIAVATREVTTLANLSDAYVTRSIDEYGLVTDGVGNLFLAACSVPVVSQVDLATGEETVLAGTHDVGGHLDGTGADARFTCPRKLTYDGAGTLFVSDGDTIRKLVIATGDVTTVVGDPSRPDVSLGPLPASLKRPAGLALGPPSVLFIVENSAHAVLVARF